MAEEKSALAAFEWARKKKAARRLLRLMQLGLQQNKLMRLRRQFNAAGRLNAEMRAELRVVTAAAERKRVAGQQAAKAAEKSRDLFQALLHTCMVFLQIR